MKMSELVWQKKGKEGVLVVVEQHGGNNTDWSRMKAGIGSAESGATCFPHANGW